MRIKTHIYHVLERTEKRDIVREIFERFITVVILLNALAIVLESVPEILLQYHNYFITFEIFTIIVFSIEYFLRLWTITESEEYAHPIWGRLKWMISPFGLIDLFAILPFYLPLFLANVNVRLVRVSQILRLFRIFKMGRFFRQWEVFVSVFRKKKHELRITIYTIGIILIFASSIIYFIENPHQPQAFSSIPAAMWWGVATMTTVGYGDIVPITFWGKFFGSIIALLGIGLFALPAGILGSGFIDQILVKDKKVKHCPYCKKQIVIEDPRKSRGIMARLFGR